MLYAVVLGAQISAAGRDNVKVKWMWGNAGKDLAGHMAARNNPGRWSWSKSPETVVKELKKYLGEASENDPVEFIVRDGANKIMDTRRETISEAIEVIERFTTEEGVAAERKRLDEYDMISDFDAKWMYGDAQLCNMAACRWLAEKDPLKMRWSQWKSFEDTIDELNYDWAAHRSVHFRKWANWNGTDWLVNGEEEIVANLAAAEKMLDEWYVKDKPSDLEQLEVSENVWEYLRRLQSDELKKLAKLAGIPQPTIDGCLRAQREEREKERDAASEEDRFEEARFLQAQIDSLDITKIEKLQEEKKQAAKDHDYTRAERKLEQAKALEPEAEKKDRQCLEGVVYEKTQGPRLQWAWYLGGADIEKDKAENEKMNYLSDHVCKHGDRKYGGKSCDEICWLPHKKECWDTNEANKVDKLKEFRTPQYVKKDIKQKAEAERQRQTKREVKLKTKKLTGDRQYNDETPRQHEKLAWDEAIEFLTRWKADRSGSQRERVKKFVPEEDPEDADHSGKARHSGKDSEL